MFGSTPLALERAAELAKPPPVGQPHSVALPGSKQEGRSAVYRHWRFQNELLKTLDPAITTCHEAFEATANRIPKQRCLGHRPWDPVTKTFGAYQWEDYQTTQRRRANFGAGLVDLHEKHGVTGSKYPVGLWCQNRPEWQITDLACMSQGLFTVSIYDTLGPDTAEYIINHANLACVVTSLAHVTTLLKLKPRLPSLKFVVVLDPLTAGEQPGQSKADLLNSLAKDIALSIHSLRDVEAAGEKSPRPYNPPTPDDVVTINYTSGTTGDPKGVVLTHANAVSATMASFLILKSGTNDVTSSFLPLAHIYQRVGEHTALASGAAIGYFHGNIAELVDDLKLIRPTAMAAVPRLYNRFGTAIKENTMEQAGFKGALSRHIVATKLAAVNNKTPGAATNKHAFYDRIWAKKIQAALGLDRCKTLVSGSAPLDPSLHQFLRVVTANHFLQGYGLTETYAVSLAQLDGDVSSGNCGAVSPNGECCLEDVPDMEYLSSDKPYPRGELLIRSGSLFREYYRNEAETSKAIDKDGWFHTGDICHVDELGRFKIIDRKKNVLKLSQGEYISPERLENVYLANLGWLATAYVHGDSYQSFLVGIFGIAPDSFAAFAGKVLGETIDHLDLAKLNEACQNPRVVKAALAAFDKVGKKNKFNSYERVRSIKLFIDPFTIDNELLTPTLKLKRPQAAKKFRDHIDELYDTALEEEKKNKPKAKL
ncbi:long-chain-fatty-acid-CoA ligase/ protein binding protein [Mytilinidion resinicola]|uniref:Long-chain-fatty-acid-CoA ligase/ protein binding protein n=1 Tax=Mytilinidion resinicola TaxID=574789 RepID=A0A6A6YU19_9PEZI|nr:long-chain-fatty-acid-CoA ligase/ protein binding protein [Mytilinidion resinicola]KAF2811883.1 long-chain-fatty-acid-CoA ligase/ protein binding protein [Mytilinidion resinicola]